MKKASARNNLSSKNISIKNYLLLKTHLYQSKMKSLCSFRGRGY
jgi:hypothetical protein